MRVRSPGLVLFASTVLLTTGCSKLENRLIEEEFYGTKPFSPAGTNTVLPPKLDRVDLFSHIARGDFCVHHRILTGVDLAEVPLAQDQPTTSGFLANLRTMFDWSKSPVPSIKEPQIAQAEARAAALENQEPARARAERCRAEVDRITTAANDTNYSVSQRLARAYDEFTRMPGQPGTSLSIDQQRQRRNEVQGEILRASERRCNAYKLYLQTIQSNASFGFGSAATVLGGLGAIFTDAGVARALSGAAGITSGVGAQFQESFFLSIAVPAIAEGIDNARQSIHGQIVSQRDSTIHAYTLQHAILDAVRYDGACSIPRGLQEVAEAARNVRTPSAFVMTRAIEQFAEARRALNGLTAVESTDIPSSVFGSASGGLRQSEVEDTVLRSPLEGIKAQEVALRAQEAAARSIFARIRSDVMARSENERSDDEKHVISAADLALAALAAATNRTMSQVAGTTVATQAAALEAALSGSRATLASRQSTPEQKRSAQIESNVSLGQVRTRVLAPLQQAVAPLYAVLEATRTISTAVEAKDRVKALCALVGEFNKVHPAAPAASPAAATVCS